MAEDTNILFGSFHENDQDYQLFLKLFEDEKTQSTSLPNRVQFPWDPTQYAVEENFPSVEFGTQSYVDVTDFDSGNSNNTFVRNQDETLVYVNPSDLSSIEASPIAQNRTTQSSIMQTSAINYNQNNKPAEDDMNRRTETEVLGEDITRKRRNKKKRDPDYYKRYTESCDYQNLESEEPKKETVLPLDAQVEPWVQQIEPESSSSGGEGVSVESTSKLSSISASRDYDLNQSTLPELPLDHRTSGNTEVSSHSDSSSNFMSVKNHDAFHSTPENASLSKDVPQTHSESVTGLTQDLSFSEGIERTLDQNQDSTRFTTITSKSDDLSECDKIDTNVTLEVKSLEEATPTLNDQKTENIKTEETQATELNVSIEEKAKVPPPKPTSWASLFKGGSSGPSVSSSEGSNPVPVVVSYSTPAAPEIQEDEDNDNQDPVPVEKDPRIKGLGGFLLPFMCLEVLKDRHKQSFAKIIRDFEEFIMLPEYFKNAVVNHKAMFLLPRGLINVANNCYINSILQILIACPPFYNFIQRVPLPRKGRGPSSTPMLDAILQLSRQFHEVPMKSKKSQDLRQGEPFEPTMVYTMLTRVNTSLGIKQGRQEDAEEFLGCLLNGLHDEMVAAIQVANGVSHENGPKEATPNGIAESPKEDGEEDEEDEWEQVGPKNKTSVIRKADFNRSPVYNIFGGQMRSALHQQGVKESAMLQPFFTLQLDIQSSKILTVKDALENLGTREAVHGFMSNKTKTEVEASKRTSLEELPPVLILHLKRFVFDKTGGCQKLMKKMEYDMDLEISRDLLSPNARMKIPSVQRNYKLFGVIYHTGKETYGGHYISDFYHVGTNNWVRADDNNIKNVPASQVLKPPIPFTPYLLFYRRREMLPSSQNLNNSSRSNQAQAKT